MNFPTDFFDFHSNRSAFDFTRILPQQLPQQYQNQLLFQTSTVNRTEDIQTVDLLALRTNMAQMARVNARTARSRRRQPKREDTIRRWSSSRVEFVKRAFGPSFGGYYCCNHGCFAKVCSFSITMWPLCLCLCLCLFLCFSITMWPLCLTIV